MNDDASGEREYQYEWETSHGWALPESIDARIYP